MRSAFLASALLGLSACGGISPQWQPIDRVPDGPADTVTGPTGGDDTWDFETPTDWTSGGEAWRFDLRGATIDGLPDVFGDLPLELVFQVESDDAPSFDVRTAAIVADTVPGRQDVCVAATWVFGLGDTKGNFWLEMGPGQVDFGQPWTWDSVALSGSRGMGPDDGIALGTIVASIPAEELAIASFGSATNGCADLADQAGLICQGCVNQPGACVTVNLDVDGRLAVDFVLEPIGQGDVNANPDCE